ncbi:type 4a pilus biogenesis protein PilO [Patescibacteria group bacterium]|nr:type 4a pilus biogenesis protein PilO [Patescibacteria group bacterium]MBU2214272.1 type 4a pilus biogenesis protein PilO [Patescibacteria group bacterium]
MKIFWKKYKVQIVLAGYCLMLGGFIYGGIFTMIKHIRTEADEIQKKIIDDEVAKKNLAKIPQLMNDYTIFSSQEKNLNVILQKESEVEFIKSLENLAKETGNEISLKLIEEEGSQSKNAQGKTKAKEKEGKDIFSGLPYENYITIQLELKGGYPELMRFLKKLENMEYAVNVMTLDLKKEKKQTEERSNNPFIDSGSASISAENPEGEILKSLINLIVYIR